MKTPGLIAFFFLFASKVLSQTNQPNNDVIYTVVEVIPEYPGGNLEMSRFIAQELHYPIEARRHGIEGKVFVLFVVGKEGLIEKESIRVIKGVYPALDDEAIRVVGLFPAWKPGLQDGAPVRAQFVLPLKFALTKK